MVAFTYLDFDLLLERTASGYRARVLRSPAGETTGEFRLPLSDLELENFLLRMGRPRRRVRRLETPETQAAKVVGGQIFNAIFSGSVLSYFQTSLDEARSQEAGLRIRLRLTDAPELADLPWEYLYHPALNRFLTLSKETPIVRFLELPERPRALAVTPPLKVLVMISSPSDYEQLDVAGEWARLRQALGDLEQRGMVILEVLENASLPALQRQLRRGEYHIFHFVGHGGFDEAAQDGALLLEDPAGRGQPVSGQNLGTLLNDHRSLRLAILNACEGARASRTDPFAGTAQSLLQQGLPAVIAMQFEITDEAAITFAHEFYSAIADGLPVDAALAEARRAIFASGNQLEWGTPVLYTRAADGRIFEISKRPQPTPATPKVSTIPPGPNQAPSPAADQLYTEALEAFYTQQWPRAVALLQRVLAVQPDHQGASGKLAEAEREQILAQRYEAGQMACAAGAWPEAVEALAAVVAIDPGYHDAHGLLKNAEHQAQLAKLHAEAQRLFRAQSWQAVVNVFERIAAIDPAHPDPEGLLTAAQTRLAAAEQERLLAKHYRQGLEALDAGQWAAAAAQFSEVARLTPGYRDSEALLARAHKAIADQRAAEEREARLAEIYRQAIASLEAGRWPEGIRHLEEIVRAAPGYKDADTRLGLARQAQAEDRAAEEQATRLAELYAQAQKHLMLHDWTSAITLLEQIAQSDPAHRDVASTLTSARRNQALDEAFDSGLAHFQARRYDEALVAFQRVAQAEPAYRRPGCDALDVLIARAREITGLPQPPARSAAKSKTLPDPPRPATHNKPTGLPE